jgi:hypothetical protein
MDIVRVWERLENMGRSSDSTLVLANTPRISIFILVFPVRAGIKTT